MITLSDRKMPSTAPTAAPADTPRISGDTSGLRNMFWYAAPQRPAPRRSGWRPRRAVRAPSAPLFRSWDRGRARYRQAWTTTRRAGRPPTRESAPQRTRQSRGLPARRTQPPGPAELGRRSCRRSGWPQQLVELCVGRRLVVAAGIEIAHDRPQVFRENVRIQDTGKPAQADQAADRRRRIDP